MAETNETGRFLRTVCERQYDGDIVITDPCYIIRGDKWYEFCENYEADYPDNPEYAKYYHRHPEVVPPSMIYHSTLYGDWSCTTLDVTNKKPREIGAFCADAGMVCCCLLSDAIAENAEFEKNIKDRPWQATVIRGFKGVVKFNVYDAPWEHDESAVIKEVLSVEGEGTFNGRVFKFKTIQTGA